MSNISNKLVMRTDRPLDALLLDILHHVDVATYALGIEYFVGGALARDLILLHVFGKDTGRATRDVDLGICINDWAQFEALRARLIEGGCFVSQAGVTHRLNYRTTAHSSKIPLDLLPFGGIEEPDHMIAWPPEMDIVMNVAGFSDARASALMVEIEDNLTVPVASLPSLAILKLLAWRDRHLETQKDASDFLLITRNYAEAGNMDRLYETESSLLQAANFDPDVAGALLLGQDAAIVCSHETSRVIDDIFQDTKLKQRLIDSLLRSNLSAGGDPARSKIEQFITAFFNGFSHASRTENIPLF